MTYADIRQKSNLLFEQLEKVLFMVPFQYKMQSTVNLLVTPLSPLLMKIAAQLCDKNFKINFLFMTRINKVCISIA